MTLVHSVDLPFNSSNSSYGLVSEQKKGSYRYFVDLGDRLEAVEPKTVYVDDVGPHLSFFYGNLYINLLFIRLSKLQ